METITEILAQHERVEVFAPGHVLFRQGQQLDGVYYLHSGEVDLCFSTAKESKTLLVASTGEILGLTSIMSNRPHDCSATTRTTCITGYVEKYVFLKLLDEKPDLWLTVLRMISSNISQCWDCMRGLAGVR